MAGLHSFLGCPATHDFCIAGEAFRLERWTIESFDDAWPLPTHFLNLLSMIDSPLICYYYSRIWAQTPS
jgi:hypothetical protein